MYIACIKSYPKAGEASELLVALGADEVGFVMQSFVEHEIFFVVERRRALVAPARTSADDHDGMTRSQSLHTANLT